MKLRNLLAILAVTFCLAACSSSSDSDPTPDPPSGRTVLVYMVATNNMGQNNWDAADIAEMKQAASQLNGGRLLVYLADRTLGNTNSTPRLFEIDSEGREIDVTPYDDSEPSVSIARMRQVLDDAFNYTKTPSKALILWSHGTGWLTGVNGYTEADRVGTYSFGMDHGDDNVTRVMSLPALAQALSGHHFDFIYFDCCLMGTVETIYELRHATGRIIASPTEIPLAGMPYDKNIPEFFKSTPDLAKVIDNTRSSYSTDITVSLYATDAVERLAQATRAIYDLGVRLPAAYKPKPFWRRLDNVPTGSYCMYDYIQALTPADDADASTLSRLKADWTAAFNAVVLRAKASSSAWGLPMTDYRGLGSNIATSAEDSRLGYGYRDLRWWTDVMSHAF